LVVRAQGDPADCVRIDDDAARLVCYDRAHQRAPVPAGVTKPDAGAASATPPPSRAAASLYDDRWDLDGRRKGELFFPRAYKPVYALPFTWTDRVNERPTSPQAANTVTDPLVLRPIEVKYQLSLKAKLWEDLLGTPLRVWGGYTQSSRWQVYNGHESRPFRETNYEPEVIFAWPLDRTFWGWRLRQLSLALNHQSNGRELPLSRSWNRVIGEAAFERDHWTLQVRPWLRLNERAADDDNPDISDHIGRSEVLLTGKLGPSIVALQLRHSLRGGGRSRGSAQLEWAYPIDGALHAYSQWFVGYGESLIDYNHRQNRIGLGVSIVEWR
jgi:phospholipase A1